MRRMAVSIRSWVLDAGPTACILQGILVAYYAVAATKFYQMLYEKTGNLALALAGSLLFFVVPASAATIDGEWLEKHRLAKIGLWLIKIGLAVAYAFRIQHGNVIAVATTALTLFACDVLAALLADLAERRHRHGKRITTVAQVLVAPGPGPSRDANNFSTHKLSRLASAVALYPDALIANVLMAATHWTDVPQAARWAQAHRDLRSDELASAMIQNGLFCHRCVQALLPFVTVLSKLRYDMDRTAELGKAVELQTGDLLDTIQMLRSRAWDWGALRPCKQIELRRRAGAIEIHPRNPNLIHAPEYDFVALHDGRRPEGRGRGFIDYKRGVRLGEAFHHWGWREAWINWSSREIIANGELRGPLHHTFRG